MYIKNLIAQGEHETLEFKYEVNDPRKIAKTLTAFANTKGGKLLVGVKDNGVITGISTDEEYYMVESGAKLYSKPEVEFEAKVYTEPGGKQVLEFTVKESHRKPHCVTGKDDSEEVYVRVNDENISADKVWIKACKTKYNGIKTKYDEKHNELLGIIEKKGPQTLISLTKKLFVSEAEIERLLVDLVASDLIAVRTSISGTLYEFNSHNHV